MKRIIVLLVYFCVSLNVFTTRANAQNSQQKSLAGTVWRSSYFRHSAQIESLICFQLTFYGDGTFTRLAITEKVAEKESGEIPPDLAFEKWFGSYTEELNRRVLLAYKHPATGQTYTAGMNCQEWGAGRMRTLSFVVVPEHPERQENLMFTKIKEFKFDAATHDIEVGKGNFVNSGELDDVSKMLCGKMWQEKIDPKKATVEIPLRGFLFNSNKTYSKASMLYNPNSKKVSFYRSKHRGTYRIENGLLYLKDAEGKETNFTLVSITDSSFVLSENKVICEFAIMNSKDDNVTQKFTVPYIKDMIARNYKLDSLLEDISKPYRTVKGKSYVNVVANPKSGTETLQFLADGKMFQKFQAPPADGFPTKDGRYIETAETLTTIISKPPTDDYITTEYKLNWIDSNQFELTKKNSKDKPLRFVVINQKSGK